MKKRVFAISMAGLTAASALLSGCGASGNAGASGTDSAASGSADGGELYVYNWGEYIDEDVISQFEDETGITVVYDLFETNEEMYPVIEAGAVNYDVVCPLALEDVLVDGGLMDYLPHDGVGSCDGCLLLCPQV